MNPEPSAVPVPHPILIIKLGDTFDCISRCLGDFEDWMQAGLTGNGIPLHIIDPRRGDTLPAHAQLSGAVLTGSHAMVTEDAAWRHALQSWLVDAVRLELPVLGICFGHQLLAHAMGGEVAHHPQGVEIGTVQINRCAEAASDPLMQALPDTFAGQCVHWQSVRRLPDGAVRLAGNAFEPNQAFRIGRCAWGLQFHPEFSAQAMRDYLEELRPTLTEQGLDADLLSQQVRDTPESAGLLQIFARYATSVDQSGEKLP
jgi:GMP synthase (glutamine-hydrolysing)